MSYCETLKKEEDNNNNSSCTSNKNMETECSSASKPGSSDHQRRFSENDEQSNDSDDSEIFMHSNSCNSDDDVQLSSPSNSDGEQQWYAYRGRVGINLMDNDNRPLLDNLNMPDLAQPAQPEEEDFLEMDFEPENNSEIENEAKFSDYVPLNGSHNNHSSRESSVNNSNTFSFNPPTQDFRNLPQAGLTESEEISKNTGTRPKQPTVNKNQKIIKKHAMVGDSTFHIVTDTPSNNATTYNSCTLNKSADEVYNIGASSSRALLSDRPSRDSSNMYSLELSNSIHKSPSKTSNHQQNKHQRLHEEQNDLFLFDIEPIKPRNSVTIYTTNCDEKVFVDALTSLNLEFDREIISSYFSRTSATSSANTELNLVDYIIYRSKLNCDYKKLIDLLERACKNEDEGYDGKKFEVNFYPLDLFSTTPEMIDIPVSEIVKRWNPQTDLTPLAYKVGKYFLQTNVLGKIVHIIRKINQKPPATFKENDILKIPQFYVSGYVTITLLCSKQST